MKDTTPLCYIDKVVSIQGGGLYHFVIMTNPINIASDGIGNFTCPIGISSKDVAKAHIFMSFQYRTLFWRRSSKAEEFTWETKAASPRWVQGAFPAGQ